LAQGQKTIDITIYESVASSTKGDATLRPIFLTTF